jgi:KipI family sensor histidine kinase inhibitor
VSLIVRASDQAFLVVFDDAITPAAAADVRRLHAWLASEPIPGVVDTHPAFATVLVRFDARRHEPATVERELALRLASLREHAAPEPASFAIRVRYGGEDGPDLDEVASATGLRAREVIEAHAGAAYRVAFLGFSPGFPYLTGLPACLATARRSTPRRRVPAGSVAIAGMQAGIYPVASPGGWNVIGRTDLSLFDAARPRPALLAPGDLVRFVPEDAPR